MILGRKDVCFNVLKFENLFKSIQQDFKLYLYFLGVFCLFRIAFIVVLKSYISEGTTLEDIFMALYYGIRISLKSAGVAAIVSMVLCSGLALFSNSKKISQIRYGVGCLYIGILSLLFYARIPYYEQFHMGFNQLLFNTFNDDVTAIFYTLVEEYNLPVRLLMTAVTTVFLSKVLKLWLNTPTYHLPRFKKWYQNIIFRVSVISAIYFLMIFLRYSGSMSYAHNIDWENSGLTKDEFLNEAILDDVQALYRAYSLHDRVVSSTGLDMDPAAMAEYGNYIAGRPVNSTQVDDYFRKQAQGTTMKKPRHIFLLVGESYANWPLLPQYQGLNIANGMKDIIKQEESAYVSSFLPNGMCTISGLMGIITGLAEANLYLTYLPESYKEPYSTAIAPQMKKLGYKSRFWYAGPTSWERIKEFSLAQGFEEFYGMGDIESQSGNVWGCDDKYLFKAVEAGIDNGQPTFNIIMNISNHAPFTVNLAEEGFDENTVIAGLPDKLKGDKELIKKLGHFWYADKVMAEFIANTRKKYPDSLFIVVGDHADRLNLDNNPSLYERYGVPFIVYGQGITKESVPETAAGSHINVGSTLIELIAPQGFEYYSLGESLTRGNSMGFNYGFWFTHDYASKVGGTEVEKIPSGRAIAPPSDDAIWQEVEAKRALSWWRIKYGKNINL